MSIEDRPNPEELLKAIKDEEQKKKRGSLKIFLGMAAGVGKTYAMLEEAQKKVGEGVSVYIGVINTHGRVETAALLEGLNIIPPKVVEYKGAIFEELNLDEILRIKPQLTLVDELAHSNVPGSRHLKRWQDVMEILENGIDVYTTLNVQHIESLKDVVEKITKISIRETVPDVVIESANYIELVDLTPKDLLQRLKEGKVYLGDQSTVAAQHFFQENRLTALRELLLRFSAEKVDHDLHGMVLSAEESLEWKPRERLMVAISASPHSQKLIRTTRRLAFSLDAPWIAVHVNDGRRLREEDAIRLEKNISLARELGAEIVSVNDPDIVEGLQRVARRRNVTQIIIGRSIREGTWRLFKSFSLFDQLAKECTGVDIHLIRQESSYASFKRKIAPPNLTEVWYSYLLSSCLVAIVTIIGWFGLPYLGYRVTGFLALLFLLLSTSFMSPGPVVSAVLLFGIIWGTLFIPPIGSIYVGSREDAILLILYCLTGVITAFLVDRIRKHRLILLKGKESTQALYDIVRILASSQSSQRILERVKERLGSILNGTVEIAIKDLRNNLSLENSLLIANEKEKNATLWVFENNKEAGWSTSTLPSVENLYIPLKGFHEVVGVLAYRPSQKGKSLNIEEKIFLHTISQQVGNYIEKLIVENRSHEEEDTKRVEKIHQMILKLIFREFQEPLEGIQKSVNELKSLKIQHAEIKKIELFSDGLMHILANVYAMARLSEGLVSLNKGLHDIREVVEVCCRNVTKSLDTHFIKVKMQDNLPQLLFDFSLIEILLYNLIFNAVEYSPRGSTVEVEAKIMKGHLYLSVLDEGNGIPEDQLDTIFEKFYRIPGASSPGIGLGLSIAKSIAEIHGGSLIVENRREGGAKFTLILPREK